MATTYFDQEATNSTSALFRLWGSGLSTGIQTVWGSPTADTGQINWTTVAAPAAINTKSGYEIYKAADTLAATQPIYWRIDYGSGSVTAASPGLWITVGTGSDGAGNITASGGSVYGPVQIVTGAAAGTVFRSYLSGVNTGARARLNVGMFMGTPGNSTTAQNMFFSLERSKDTSGNDTATALIVSTCSSTGTNRATWQNYKPLAAAQPTQYTALIAANPATTMIDGLNVGVALPVPLSPAPQQPGANIMVGFNTDFNVYTTFTFTLYGTSVTWLPLPNFAGGSLTPAGGAYVHLMRFD